MRLRRLSQLGNKKKSLWKKHCVSEMSTLSERGYRKRVPVLPYSAPVSIDGPAPSPGSSTRNLTPLRGNCQSLLFVTVDPADRILLRLPRRRLLYRRAPLQSFLSGASVCPPVAAAAASSSSPCPLPRAHPPIHCDNKKRRKSLPTPSLPPTYSVPLSL